MNIAYYEMNLFHDLPMNILLIEHLIMVFRSEKGILILSLRVY